MAISGVPMSPLPLPGERFDAGKAEETNKAIEDAFHEMSQKLQDITELSAGTLAELIEGLTPDSTPDDTDLVVVANGDGTLSSVEVGDLFGGGGGRNIPAAAGRFIVANQPAAAALSVTHEPTPNRLYITPFSLAAAVSSAQVGVNVTAHSTARQLGIGVYAHNPATGLPGALLASFVTTATGAAFDKVTLNLDAGALYWFALIVDPLGLGGSVIFSALTAAEVNFSLGGSAVDTGVEDVSAYVSIATGTWSNLPNPFTGSVVYGVENNAAVFVRS